MPTLDDAAQTRLAMAALFAALVRALGEEEKSFLKRYIAELDSLHLELQGTHSMALDALEILQRTRQLIESKNHLPQSDYE